MSDKPLLGLATTRELLRELEVRAAIGRLDEAWVDHGEKLHVLERATRVFQEALPASVLDYRTVDS